MQILFAELEMGFIFAAALKQRPRGCLFRAHGSLSSWDARGCRFFDNIFKNIWQIQKKGFSLQPLLKKSQKGVSLFDRQGAGWKNQKKVFKTFGRLKKGFTFAAAK